MIDQRKLDFWLTQGLNVLFSGRHGVGKTSMVIDTFNRAGLKWKYFSAATMDPWVDFIGVPKEHTAEDGSVYLELVRPKEFRDDEVEALFFDEFNRSHKKVRNAVMELIQFRSINGRRFNNLQVVWAAVNPKDDEALSFDVEDLDPAQRDRFHVKVEIPYEPYLPFFTSKYGAAVATSALEWWKALPDEMKLEVSPRRLDYALKHFLSLGDLRDMLPTNTNISKLQQALQTASVGDSLDKFFQSKDAEGATLFLQDPNRGAAATAIMLERGEDKGHWRFFLPLLPEEMFAALYEGNSSIRQFVQDNLSKNFDEFLKLRSIPKLVAEAGYTIHRSPNPVLEDEWLRQLASWESTLPYLNSQSRGSVYFRLRSSLPRDMSPDTAKRTFRYLDQFARKVMPKTMKSEMSDLPGIVNALRVIIFDKTGQTSMSSLAPVLARRMAKPEAFAGQIWTPGRDLAALRRRAEKAGFKAAA